MPKPQKLEVVKSSKLDVQSTLKGAALHGSQYVEDSWTMEDWFNMAIHGPPGVGKTFCAMTASRFWPKTLPAPKKVMLEDTLHLAFDANAGAGLKTNRISVPTINIKKIISERKQSGKNNTILDALRIVADEMHNFVDKHGTQNVIADTISMLDKDLNQYWEEHCPLSKQGFRDTRQMWQALFTTHKRFHSDLKSLRANTIMLFHSKAFLEAETEEGKNQLRKALAAGLTEINLDVTGKATNLYTGDSKPIFYMTSRKTLKGFERILHTTSGSALTKATWEDVLEEEEVPNLQLIFGKIKAAQAQV